MPWDGGMFSYGPPAPPPSKVGRPRRDRSKNKSQRRARKRTR